MYTQKCDFTDIIKKHNILLIFCFVEDERMLCSGNG